MVFEDDENAGTIPELDGVQSFVGYTTGSLCTTGELAKSVNILADDAPNNTDARAPAELIYTPPQVKILVMVNQEGFRTSYPETSEQNEEKGNNASCISQFLPKD
ncbi:unnamed protein product [Calypogeia fissa]